MGSPLCVRGNLSVCGKVRYFLANDKEKQMILYLFNHMIHMRRDFIG